MGFLHDDYSSTCDLVKYGVESSLSLAEYKEVYYISISLYLYIFW